MGTNKYSDDAFWTELISCQKVTPKKELPGWSFNELENASFTSPPITDSPTDFFPDCSPQNCHILLISAPGAVGKSTLAKHISYLTGAIYVDLGKAKPVGGDTLTGGLSKTKSKSSWENDHTTVILDGLDEAILKVKSEGYATFIEDVVECSQEEGRTKPIILLGRKRAAEDTLLCLDDCRKEYPALKVSFLEIGYYPPEIARDFVEKHTSQHAEDNAHKGRRKELIDRILHNLEQQTGRHQGDCFAGYAPVLKVVADTIAKVKNIQAEISELKKEGESSLSSLEAVIKSILLRDHGKLAWDQFRDPETCRKALYQEEEQLDHLVSRIYGLAAPPIPPFLSPEDAKTYKQQLEKWVGEHPFLNSTTNKASSIVFAGLIAAHGLKNTQYADAVLHQERKKSSTPNPFLFDFYMNRTDGRNEIPASHVGVLYDSLKSRMAIQDRVELSIFCDEGIPEYDNSNYLVEFSIFRNGNQVEPVKMTCNSSSTLYLGGYIENVDIDARCLKVQLSSPQEIKIVAPTAIRCSHLDLQSDAIVIPPQSASPQDQGTVYLRALNGYSGTVNSVTSQGEHKTPFSVCWDGAEQYPWNLYATPPTKETGDPLIDKALLRLRRLIIECQSGGKKTLSRKREQIEHSRMTKDGGDSVRKLLLDKGVFTDNATLYELNSEMLHEYTGTNRNEFYQYKFHQKAIDFVKQALKKYPPS